MRLFAKLLLVSIVPLVATVLVVTMVDGYISEATLAAEVERTLRAEVMYHSGYIHHFIRERMLELQHMAHAPVMFRGDIDAILNYLRSEQRQVGSRFEHLYFNDLNGTVHTTAGTTFSVTDRYYYPQIERGEPVVTRVVYSRDTERAVVLMLLPVWSPDGNRLGTVAGSVEVSAFIDVINRVSLSGQGFAILAADDGYVVAGHDHVVGAGAVRPPDEVRIDPSSAFHPILQTVETGLGPVHRLSIGGRPYLILGRKIPDVGWDLLLCFDEARIFSGIQQLRSTTFWILILALLPVALAVFALNSTILRPVRHLLEVQRQFGSGNLNVRATMRSKDEIGELTQSFNSMADDLARELGERRKAEQIALENHRRLQAILDNAPAIIYTKDRFGRYEMVNRHWHRINPGNRDDAAGRTDAELFDPETARIIRQNDLEVMNRGEALEFEERVPHGNHVRVYLTVKFPVYHVSGALAGLCGISTDITGRKQAEEALEQQRDVLQDLVADRTAELDAAHRELLQKERLATLGQVMATVSHEIRNPLGTIASAMYTIQQDLRGQDRPRAERALERAERSVMRCNAIIEELLDYTRVRPLVLTPRPFDAWLDGVLDEFALPPGVTIRRVRGCPAEVHIDGERLRRCVINILQNAVQAITEHHGPTPTEPGAATGEITVETALNGGQLTLRVKDTGTGIPESTRDHIFEPLFSTKSFGVGLGLAIVKQIAEQHGGAVAVASTPGTGTAITLTLPQRPDGNPGHAT